MRITGLIINWDSNGIIKCPGIEPLEGSLWKRNRLESLDKSIYLDYLDGFENKYKMYVETDNGQHRTLRFELQIKMVVFHFAIECGGFKYFFDQISLATRTKTSFLNNI